MTTQFSLHEALRLEVSVVPPVSWMGSNGATQVPSLIEPRPFDVLCGKSKRCVDHGGSRRFRTVIECHREKYQEALTKWDKTNVTRTIYDNLTQSGSRFLKYNDGLQIWEEISPMAARDKIGHALRFANRVTRRKRNAKCIGGEPELASTSETKPLAKPQVLQVLESKPSSNPPQAQSLHIQLPPLGCIVTTPTTGSPSVPQQLIQLQPLGVQPMVPQAQTETTASNVTPSVAPCQQGMLTQTFLPLDRSEKWYGSTGDESLKCPLKPAPAALPFDDSLSLLDDIFPLNQSSEVPPAQPTSSNNDLPFDLDFDAEILSVLL